MSRKYSMAEWAEHYARHAHIAQTDADNHAKAAAEAEAEGEQARAAYLRSEAEAHQKLADNYSADAARCARKAEQLDDYRQAYGRQHRDTGA